MNLDKAVIKLCVALGIALDSATPKEIKSIVKNRAILGGAVMALPLFGLETIIYAIILWGMYASISRVAGIKFSGDLIKNILGGFIVNIVITFILNFFLDWILFFGWIGIFFAVFFATKYSGISYLFILEKFHGKNQMKTRLKYEDGIKSFKENGGDKAALKAGTGTIINNLMD